MRRGEHAKALRHLVAAGDHEACASLLIDHGGALVDSGHADAVLETAELPADYLDDPRIQRVLGQAWQVRGQWTAAMECFQRAGYDDEGELEPALAWPVGLVAYSRGEFDEVLLLFGRTRLAREDSADETRVLALAASAHRMMGDLASLRDKAARAVDAARRCGEPRAQAAAYQVMTMLAAAEGDRRQGEAHCTVAVASAEAANDLLQMLWIRLCRAFHILDMGAPRPALADAQTLLPMAEGYESLFLTAHALTICARANTRLGKLESASADFARAIDLFRRLNSRFLAWPLCGLGDLHRMRGQLARARAVYEEALALAEPCHDVLGMGAALIGLARIRAADDLAVARDLADRAVALGEGLREVPAFLTHGWVVLFQGDRQAAAADAAQAGAAARRRRDNPGLAEANILTVLASDDPAADSLRLGEAIEMWQETGCRLEEAAARIVATRIGAPIPDLRADLALQMLRDCGVDVDSQRVAGPLAVLARSTPSVSIRALGIFQVTRHGVLVPTLSKKARDLLKILVARRRPVPREQLMELLWPEADPGRASNRLYVLLSTIRDVLQPEQTNDGPLVTDGSTIGLDLTRVAVDVEEFLVHADAALQAHRNQQPDATAQLLAAAEAYTGGFLEDDPYQDWVTPLAEEVRATYLALLRAVSARLREAGDTDGVVRYTLRLLEQDPYDEKAHLNLVAVLLSAGRLGEARRRYQIYQQRMKEISVDPRPLPQIRRTQ